MPWSRVPSDTRVTAGSIASVTVRQSWRWCCDTTSYHASSLPGFRDRVRHSWLWSGRGGAGGVPVCFLYSITAFSGRFITERSVSLPRESARVGAGVGRAPRVDGDGRCTVSAHRRAGCLQTCSRLRGGPPGSAPRAPRRRSRRRQLGTAPRSRRGARPPSSVWRPPSGGARSTCPR